MHEKYHHTPHPGACGPDYVPGPNDEVEMDRIEVPCPWCKETRHFEYRRDAPEPWNGKEIGFYSIRCCSCGAQGPEAETLAGAVDKWNDR